MSTLVLHKKKRTAIISFLLLLAIALTVGIAYASSILLNPRATFNNPFIPPPKEIRDMHPRYSFSFYGKSDQPLVKPLSVVEASNGSIYVTDGGGGVVQVFDYQGRFQTVIGKQTIGNPQPGELRYPIGVAVDGNDRVYVSDSAGGHISIFENERFVGYFGEKDGKKEFSVPAGLLYRNGYLYVNDIGYHQVLVFDTNGEVRKEIGLGRGAEQGEMEFPNFSWVDNDGTVYVADSNNNRAQVFTPTGSVSRVMTQAGGARLALPRGIAVDLVGRVHVVSTFGHRVEVFDRDGNWQYSYGQQGENEAQFNFPNGLYITPNRIYIADRENNRVQVWEY